jgi:hypothetical protein
MTNRVLPNWVEIAKTCVDREDVAIALEQVYNQGVSAQRVDSQEAIEQAYSEGYRDGAENGWISYLEADQQFVDGYYRSTLNIKPADLDDKEKEKS